MPLHDWTRVAADIFHSFHLGWVVELHNVFNTRLLPPGNYALIEQHAGGRVANLLSLPSPTLAPSLLARRRSLAIRHVSGHRLVALLEIVSPANNDRARHVEDFTAKAVDALDAGVHLLVVDLFPPGPHAPYGIHGAIRQRLEQSDEPCDLPADEPLTLAAYAAGPRIEVFLEHLAIGAELPEMALFLRPDRYVNVPLAATYQAAYRGMPAFWRDVLEGREPQVS